METLKNCSDAVQEVTDSQATVIQQLEQTIKDLRTKNAELEKQCRPGPGLRNREAPLPAPSAWQRPGQEGSAAGAPGSHRPSPSRRPRWRRPGRPPCLLPRHWPPGPQAQFCSLMVSPRQIVQREGQGPARPQSSQPSPQPRWDSGHEQSVLSPLDTAPAPRPHCLCLAQCLPAPRLGWARRLPPLHLLGHLPLCAVC